MNTNPKTAKQMVHSMVERLQMDDSDLPLIIFGVVDQDKPPFTFMAGNPSDLLEILAKLAYIVRNQQSTELPNQQPARN